MNLTDMINKFREGDYFSDKDILQFHAELKEVLEAVTGKGDMFMSTKDLVQNTTYRVEDIIKARGI